MHTHFFILLLMIHLPPWGLISTQSHAEEPADTYIEVGSAKVKKSVVAIADFQGQSEISKSIKTLVDSDLKWMDLFKILDSKAFIEKSDKAGITHGSFKMSDWTSIGADYLVKAKATLEAGTITLEGFFYDVRSDKQLVGKAYKSSAAELRTIAHTFAGDIVKAITGGPSVFLTKIAMSCTRQKGKSEIFVMDFDGSNVKQVTHHRSLAFAPAWSPDGTKIAYSVFTKRQDNVRNIDLYELDLQKNISRMISNRKGINSGAAYSPDGKKLALTMSFLGNPDIFVLNPADSTVTRLTKSFGVDVDPSWSPDGKQIAFVSSRSNMPMVYTMNADGESVKRLTFAGRYNATPMWGPAGTPSEKKILFAGWKDKKFDIFVIDSAGKQIERLTKDQGNNEDPFFSPDGNFIAFSSNRSGQKTVYVMNRDGTFARKISYGLGDCVSPKWSNPP